MSSKIGINFETFDFPNRVPEAKVQEMCAEMAEMLNKSGKLCTATAKEDGTKTYSAGLGIYSIASRQGQRQNTGNRSGNQRYANLGLDRPECNRLIYLSGLYRNKLWRVRTTKEISAILKENPNEQHPNSTADFLMLCGTLYPNVDGLRAARFLRAVQKIEADEYFGDFTPFITLHQLIESGTLDKKGVACLNDLMARPTGQNGQTIDPTSVLFLPVISRVSGRGGYWTQNTEFFNQEHEEAMVSSNASGDEIELPEAEETSTGTEGSDGGIF